MLGVGFISRYPLKFFGRLEGRSLEGVRNPSRGLSFFCFSVSRGVIQGWKPLGKKSVTVAIKVCMIFIERKLYQNFLASTRTPERTRAGLLPKRSCHNEVKTLKTF